jgi:universal stress protein E
VKRFSNILFVNDSEADGTDVFERTVELATNNQASLTLIDVVDPISARLSVTSAKMTAEKLNNISASIKQQKLDELRETLSGTGIKVETKILFGSPFVEIIREVLAGQRDLLVKPVTKPSSLGERLLGGTDMKLLRKCPCPVWLVRTTQRDSYRQVIVGLDYEPENPENDPLNERIMEIATSVALANFSELHVVHAWRFEHEPFFRSPRAGLTTGEVDEIIEGEAHARERWLNETVAKSCDKHGAEAAAYLNPKIHLIQGEATKVVCECAKRVGAELVILGTVARTGIPGLIMGNTAEAILHQIDCSVLAVKPTGFISPLALETR